MRVEQAGNVLFDADSRLSLVSDPEQGCQGASGPAWLEQKIRGTLKGLGFDVP